MHLKHFGDSYDIVKKALLGWLSPFGPWGAHPMFTHEVRDSDAEAFSRFLGVPLVSTIVLGPNTDRRSYLAACGDCRSVFLDPNTGVRIGKTGGRRAPEFLFADELVSIAALRPGGLVLTFDQSLSRGKEVRDIREKLAHFAEQGLHGFAYVSHASFMVLGKSDAIVREAQESIALKSGLPEHRIVQAARQQAATAE